jgi:hypothetical protein
MRRIKAEGMEFVTAILDDARQADISFAKTLLPSAGFLSKEDRGDLQRHAMIKAPKKISPSDKTDTDEAQAEYLRRRRRPGSAARPAAAHYDPGPVPGRLRRSGASSLHHRRRSPGRDRFQLRLRSRDCHQPCLTSRRAINDRVEL